MDSELDAEMLSSLAVTNEHFTKALEVGHAIFPKILLFFAVLVLVFVLVLVVFVFVVLVW